MKNLIVLIAAVALANCVNSDFTRAVGSFGQAAGSAADNQASQLDEFSAQVDERNSARIAEDRVKFRAENNCALIAGGDASALDACKASPADPSYEMPASVSEDAGVIKGLGGAVKSYASNLVALAGSAEEDEKAFGDSVVKLSVTVADMLAELEKLGLAANVKKDRLEGAARLFAGLGNFYFAQRRHQALRRIVKETDPIIQTAAEHLSNAEEAIKTFAAASAFKEVGAAESALNKAIDNGENVNAIRTKQEELFTAVAKLKAIVGAGRAFAKLAESHSALVKAADAPASGKDLAKALEEVFTLVELAKDAIWLGE